MVINAVIHRHINKTIAVQQTPAQIQVFGTIAGITI